MFSAYLSRINNHGWLIETKRYSKFLVKLPIGYLRSGNITRSKLISILVLKYYKKFFANIPRTESKMIRAFLVIALKYVRVRFSNNVTENITSQSFCSILGANYDCRNIFQPRYGNTTRLKGRP